MMDRKRLERLVPDIIITALEGGIGYWACLDTDYEEWTECKKRLNENSRRAASIEDIAIEVILSNKPLALFDVEDADVVWDLTLDKIMKGIEQFEEEEEVPLEAIIDRGAFDAEDADRIIQYALFGELVYG